MHSWGRGKNLEEKMGSWMHFSNSFTGWLFEFVSGDSSNRERERDVICFPLKTMTWDHKSLSYSQHSSLFFSLAFICMRILDQCSLSLSLLCWPLCHSQARLICHSFLLLPVSTEYTKRLAKKRAETVEIRDGANSPSRQTDRQDSKGESTSGCLG